MNYNIKAQELRELSDEDLQAKLIELKNKLFSLGRIDSLEQIKEFNQKPFIRKTIARILTIQNNKKAS